MSSSRSPPPNTPGKGLAGPAREVKYNKINPPQTRPLPLLVAEGVSLVLAWGYSLPPGPNVSSSFPSSSPVTFAPLSMLLTLPPPTTVGEASDFFWGGGGGGGGFPGHGSPVEKLVKYLLAGLNGERREAI